MSHCSCGDDADGQLATLHLCHPSAALIVSVLGVRLRANIEVVHEHIYVFD